MSNFNPSRAHLWANFNIGDMSTGSYISLTGSTKFGDTDDDVHQITGTVFISGTLSASSILGVGSSFTAPDTTINNSIVLWSGSGGDAFTGSTAVFDENANLFMSGTIKAGDVAGDIHQITGSVYVTNTISASTYLGVGASITTPAASGDNALVRWDGTGADTINDSAAVLDDAGNLKVSGSYIVDITGSTAIISNVTDVFDAIGFTLDTENKLQTIGGKLLSLQNSGSEMLQVDISGTMHVAENLKVTGSLTASAGGLEIGWQNGNYRVIESISASAGPNINAGLALSSGKVDQSGSTSVKIIANVRSSSIDDNHKIAQLYWTNDSGTEQESWSFTTASINSEDNSTATILGTEDNSSTSIGVIMGTNTEYSASGAKVASFKNGTKERSYLDAEGQFKFGMTNATGSTFFKHTSELISYTSQSFHNTVNQVPAGALLYGVSVNVVSAIPGDEFFIGLAGSEALKGLWGNSVSSSAGSNNATSSLSQGWTHFTTASAIRLTAADHTDITTTGSVRVELRYMTLDTPSI